MDRPRLSLSILAVAALALFSGNRLGASDAIGIFASIDRVLLEPEGKAPETIRITGAFTFANPSGVVPSYAPPVYGLLYYSLRPGEEAAVRAEWNDMKSIAGTGQVISFGSRYDEKGTLHGLCEAPLTPDLYPPCIGICKIRSDTEYEPIQGLLGLPHPVAPLCGQAVPPGSVTLSAMRLLDPSHPSASYLFEIQGGSAGSEKSAEIPIATSGPTSWTPSLQVEADRKYTWLVHARDGKWEGPPVSATFLVGDPARGDVNGDGRIDVSDPVKILFYLFLGDEPPAPLSAADADSDGEVTVSDSIFLLEYLFEGGPIPPPFDLGQ